MYKFTRLRALLLALSVTQLSWRRLCLRWLWTILRLMFAAGFITAIILRTPQDAPITWQDITAHDAAARSFLILSCMSLATGFYLVIAAAQFVKLSFARVSPPPDTASTLRQAARARDSQAAPIVMEQQSQNAFADDAYALKDSSFVVAVPELLTRPMWAVIAAFVGSALALAAADFLASLSISIIPQSVYDPNFDPSMGLTYSDWSEVGIFLMLGVLAFMSAWRSWNSWRGRGAYVEVSAGGLIVRGPETLWRRRFIPWRDAQSLARIVYNDTYAQARTVYMLDAGNQTLLWESPPDMRYASLSRRARIAQRQTSAAQLVALISMRASLPLRDISGRVNAVAKIEPNPRDASFNQLIDQSIYGISPSMPLRTLQAAVAEVLDRAKAEAETASEPPPPPPPPLPIGVRLEQWRRRLNNALALFAYGVGLLWFYGGLRH